MAGAGEIGAPVTPGSGGGGGMGPNAAAVIVNRKKWAAKTVPSITTQLYTLRS
jgi:hypothetical protein